jgi:N-terminal half of MaoC dehydratase
MTGRGSDSMRPGCAGDWAAAWEPMVSAVGTEFGGDEVVWGADRVERGLIRRFLEPLEFDCPLHLDDEIARTHGYPGIVAPITAMIMFTAPALWSTGDPPTFDSDARDSQPGGNAGRPVTTGLEPLYTGYFATDFELEVVRPLSLGARLGRRGRRLTACKPRETRVGRGAFVTWETQIVDDHLEVVALNRYTVFLYNPGPAAAR